MMRLPVRSVILVSALAFMLATTAEAAQKRKHKKSMVAATTVSMKHGQTVATRARHWGLNLVRAGPLYNGPDYLGDDPDPNIRAQLLRDLSIRYGGGEP